MVNCLQGVNEAAVLGEIGQLGELLFVDHVQASRCAYRKDNSQVEQVILFELRD